LKILLLATSRDLSLQPGLIIDQTPQPGEEVNYGYPVGLPLLCEVGGIGGYEEIAMKTLTQKIGDIGTARRKRVEARAAALIAEEISHDLTGLRSRKGNLPKRLSSPRRTRDGSEEQKNSHKA
jgi:hypothetical protein